ncbi:MAG: hypothetical protein WD512_15605, partial [Candidatus Paceibacterota bacterium]
MIPNSMAQVMDDCRTNSIGNICKIYKDDIDVLISYFDLLLSKELGFIGSELDLKLFPDISFEWDYPSLVSNSIIDINSQSSYNVINAIHQLDRLGCTHIQLRCFS